MIFVATPFSHLVNLKQLPMVLTPFPTFQLSSEMHCRTFFVHLSSFFLQTLRTKYRMLPSCRFFLLDVLKLKIVNCKYFLFIYAFIINIIIIVIIILLLLLLLLLLLIMHLMYIFM